MMQNPPSPAKGDEAPIPTEIVSNGDSNEPHSSDDGTVALRRKAARRSLPWDLAAGELDLASPPPPPPQDEDIPARKKRRLEEPLPTKTDEAASKTASPDVSVGLLPPAAAADICDTNADATTDKQPNDGVRTLAPRRWTTDEDAKLTSAVANTSKKKRGGKYKTDWNAVAALIPDRSRSQCHSRWQNGLDSSVEGATRCTGKWAVDEDSKLKDAVQTHGNKKWVVICALVPGRTRQQCYYRWHSALDPKIVQAAGRTGKWAEDEDSKLKEAVQMHGGKNWAAISALIPGRTRTQCCSRWHDVGSIPTADNDDTKAYTVTGIQPNAGATGGWTLEEDVKLTNAVANTSKKKWGSEYKTDWNAVAALVPGRTKSQCKNKWNNVLDPSIDRANRITAKWVEDEDDKLKDAVQMHGGKNWAAIATLVPGRTITQCRDRWNNVLDPSIDRANRITAKWTIHEDIVLKDAVQTLGGKDWAAIAALVPGRTTRQCCERWNDALNPSIDRANGRTGKWTIEEDVMLKDAVQTHGGKNWSAIAALVPGRTTRQCKNRWHTISDTNIDRASGRTGK
jgi:hypothetical protein